MPRPRQLTRHCNIARLPRRAFEFGAYVALSSRIDLRVASSSCFPAGATMGPMVVAEPGVACFTADGRDASINGNGTRIKFDHVRNDGRARGRSLRRSRRSHDSGSIGRASVLVIIIENGRQTKPEFLISAPPRNETTWGWSRNPPRGSKRQSRDHRTAIRLALPRAAGSSTEVTSVYQHDRFKL